MEDDKRSECRGSMDVFQVMNRFAQLQRMMVEAGDLEAEASKVNDNPHDDDPPRAPSSHQSR